MIQPYCGETVDLLWKTAAIGMVGFFVYRWAVKEGVTQGAWGSRGAKYISGRAKSLWGA
jgi:hypothetical protein